MLVFTFEFLEYCFTSLCIKDKTSLTLDGLMTGSFVIGHSPPLANVAPITARVSQFNSIEHVYENALKQFKKICFKKNLKSAYLKVKIQTILQNESFGEAFVFLHVIS